MISDVLLTNGDSWTYGSEIVAPEFMSDIKNKIYKESYHNTSSKNDYYRIPRIWPYPISKNLSKKLINIAWPARSNDSIYDSTISWILENYIEPKKSTENLLVVIGWTTPERKNIIFTEDDHTFVQTLWPAMVDQSYYKSDIVRDYFYMHVNHLLTEYEYISRFINHCYDLSIFCKLYQIKLYMFNAFYETPSVGIKNWKPGIDISNMLSNWDASKLSGWIDNFFNWKTQFNSLKIKWDSIPENQFILKDKGSFKGYIDKYVDQSIRLEQIHPSAESHIAWGNYVSTWIDNDNKKGIL